MPDPLFDPLTGPQWILDGRIVTMTGRGAVIDNGRVYIDGGRIVAVQDAAQPPPAGFAATRTLNTGGTIYPGLIELHNHLAYNVLPLWNVPRLYANRGQWGSHKEYRKLISGPMSVLGRTDGLVQAVVRWSEAKCLVGGTTTSQGIALYSNAGITRYYRGLVRNVEETNDPELPEASTRIGDVTAGSGAKFLQRLETYRQKGRKLILHLAEGTDTDANDHFRALKIDKRRWAINEALVGIHSTGLHGRNFRTLAVRGGSIVWSPLSNLLLYGATTDIKRAIDDGTTISLGSDWSPSGSKNLLMEMKAARVWCDSEAPGITDYEIVEMVTSNPARIVGWGEAVGTIEAGKRADLVILGGKSGDPYAKLIAARESTVALVVINGVRRYGQTRFLRDVDNIEERTVADSKRVFNLTQEGLEQSMVNLSIEEAEVRLRAALTDLPALARALEEGAMVGLATADGRFKQVVVGAGASLPGLDGNWFLALDHADTLGLTVRPKLRTEDRIRTGVFQPSAGSAVPLSELLGPIQLDELAAPDDETMWDTLAEEANLPHPVKRAIFHRYNRKAPPAVGIPQQAERVDPSEARTPKAGEEPLTRAQRLDIVRQALVLMKKAYVHRQFKEAHHAVRPIQRLKLLEHRLAHQSEGELDEELVFHNEMTRIFSSLRDLHTSYVLPRPYQRYRAVLPFLVEEYFAADGDLQVPRYLVTRVAPGSEHSTFTKGAEILHWNGLPIRVAIDQNADLQAGGNPAAAFARGLQALTVRSLMVSLPPDEDWVTITYRGTDNEVRQIRQEWVFERINTPLFSSFESATDTAVGIDLRAYEVGRARKWLFARPVAEAEFAAQKETLDDAMMSRGASIATTMPGIFKPKVVGRGDKGYVRIFTFMTDEVDDFVDEFERLIRQLPQEGLIIDVRGNGGGVIHAAERLLQLLTERPISPSRAQFASTDLMREVCVRHAPSHEFEGLSFAPWVSSLDMSVTTGETYSRAFPITPRKVANEGRGYVYPGRVVLVVDALCYSATDIFAAGFIDHMIGEVLGTSDNTGAGGANVWTHTILRTLAGPNSDLGELPNGAEMRVAVRRVVRVGEASGQILEDIGISTDRFHRHYLTKRDIEESNEDLIAAALDLLDG
jgi:cytosine/adenosine deaminase-related metal-dependent hydrolase/C-terminal processing protease CtpA/Prc